MVCGLLSINITCDKRVLVDDMGEYFYRKVDNICNGVSGESKHKIPEDKVRGK